MSTVEHGTSLRVPPDMPFALHRGTSLQLASVLLCCVVSELQLVSVLLSSVVSALQCLCTLLCCICFTEVSVLLSWISGFLLALHLLVCCVGRKIIENTSN